jgi:uroporphyrinogen-III decarboxylase
MIRRWIEVAPGALEKREKNFEAWISGQEIPFESEAAKMAYQERARLIRDAALLRQPRRIPVCPAAGHFPIAYSGISWYEAMYNYEKLAFAWEKYHTDFTPDNFSGPRSIVPGKVLEILDFGLYKWAGQDLNHDLEYQYVEGEYMKAEEYDDLIDDPTGFFLHVYFPRIFGGLKALKKLPIMPPVHEIPMIPPAVMPFASEEMRHAFYKLEQAGQEANKWKDEMVRIGRKLLGKGYPANSGGMSKAPFDVIGDTLRGTKGIMMDMYRRPEKLKEACERITPIMIKYGVASAKAAGHLMPYLPLHKGADGFMSDEQFKTFYWPTLRKVIIGLVDEGLVPILFAEGGYNQRLEVISDLPKGTTVWYFDRTDMARAKETIGKVACLQGNVPLSLLCTGNPEEVKAYCKTLIDTAGKNGGFIFSAAGGMQYAKAENVKTMIDFAKDYGVYR